MQKTSTERMIAEQLISVFSENDATKRYFQSDIDWLQNRLAAWEQNYIRVGLVGVTSSGKSTLLNAILGDDILPTAVRPSSGTLITCSKGKKVEANVYFEDGSSIKLPIKSLKQQLQKYGDESYNEKNKYKVKMIDVKSPHFLFSEKIQIIDSPGLDAYGLERHEKITMEMLLPTVDLCMYVVTLKANSDAITREILQTIYEHEEKPLVIVQNMLDSVEPKIGKAGVTLKTRHQVAAEHKQRIQRLLNDIDPTLAQIVSIVQLSAKKAVDGRKSNNSAELNESQIQSLIDYMAQQEKKMEPKLYVERTSQIARHLITLHDREEKIVDDVTTLEEIAKEQEKELDTFTEQKDKLYTKIQLTQQSLRQKLIQLDKQTSSTVKKIKALDPKEIDACKRLLEQVKKETSGIEEVFIRSMRELNKEVAAYLQLLNMNIKDYEKDRLPSSIQTKQHFAMKTKIETETRKRKKSGALNGVKRFFGDFFDTDWGYEYRNEDVEVIDVQAISTNIKSYQEKFSHQVTIFISQWDERSNKFLHKAAEEIKRRKSSLKEKLSNLLEQQKVIDILAIIKTFLEKINNNKPIKEVARKKQKEPTKRETERLKIKVKQETLSLYHLSHHLLNQHFTKCFAEVERRNQKHQKTISRTIIWGWDTPSILSFVERYTSIPLTEAEEKKLENNGIIFTNKNKQLMIVNENKIHPQLLDEIMALVESGQYNVYVLIHLIQSGQSQKAMTKSPLHFLPNIQNVPVNIVIQSIHEFKVSRNIDEGIRTLYDMFGEVPLFKKGELLVNDKNPLYSMISMELSQPQTIIPDAQEVFRLMKERFQYLLAAQYEEHNIHLYVKALINCRGGRQNEQISHD